MRDIFEINNICYVVGHAGISTLTNECYKFPSNTDYFYCSSCLVGNNILVLCVRGIFTGVESFLFDPNNKQWSGGDIETEKDKFAVVEYLNKICIVGGMERGNDGNTVIHNKIEIYDTVNKTPVLLPIKMIQARCYHRVIVYKNKLYVFGGYNYDDYILSSVEMYSPADANKFVLMTSMKIARYSFGCCRVGNLVYVIGGWTRIGLTNSVEIFNLDTNTWTDGVDFPKTTKLDLACAVNSKIE